MKAEEILKNQRSKRGSSIRHFLSKDEMLWEMILNAMEEFAEHQNKELIERELEDENKELIKELAKRDKIIIQQKEAIDYYIEIINSQAPTTIQKT
jgi:hypothetical protein